MPLIENKSFNTNFYNNKVINVIIKSLTSLLIQIEKKF
jgi:hypothetical protein